MKEKIEKLSKGIFEYELPDILLSEAALQVQLPAGRVFCGSFFVKNKASSVMKGILYSSHSLLVLKNDRFIGAMNEIFYEFHGEYLTPGTTLRGEISIISDCGEAKLPFQVSVLLPYCDSSLGPVRDLFQLTNLAKADWNEAKSVFVSENFEKALFYKEKTYARAYKQLRAGSSLNQALEEFLVTVHKKSPIRFRADKSAISFSVGEESRMERLALTKDTWGYAALTIRTEGDFFSVSRRLLTTEEFIGNRFELEIEVNGEHLRDGKHFGRILIETVHQSITVEVTCVCKKEPEEARLRRRRIRGMEAKLTELYLKFRQGKTDASAYIAESDSLAGAVSALLKKEQEEAADTARAEAVYEKQAQYELYRAYLALIGGKVRRNKETALHIRQLKDAYGQKGAFLEAACLYLEAMADMSGAATEKNTKEIERLCAGNGKDYRLFWFLLYMDKRYDSDKALRLRTIKELFQAGCHSPVFYYEAVMVWNREPLLLRELSEFELQAVQYALRRGILNKEAALQVSCLAAEEKQYKNPLFFCLTHIYTQYHLTDALRALCTLLILAGKKEHKYHSWYQQGIRAQLSLPQLPEYYIYSADLSDMSRLEQPVLLYFIYNHSLSAEYQAYLYANILSGKEENSAMYRAYLKKMEQFAVAELKNYHIDKNLAVVYSELLRKPLLDEEAARALPEIMYRHCLECKNPNIKEVCIVHKEEETETIVPLKDGQAQFDLYTENAEILLIDKDDCRYLSTVDYSVKPLLSVPELAEYCYESAGGNRKLLLNLLERAQTYRQSAIKPLELQKRLLSFSNLTESFKQECVESIVNYYYDHFEGELLDAYLLQLDLKQLGQAERSQKTELLIIRELYEQAAEAVRTFGYETVAVKRLARLCDALLQKAGAESNALLLQTGFYVFRHSRCEEGLLTYLVKHYYGTTADMFELWKEAKERELDTEELEERVLGQMLFAESYMTDSLSVFMSYYQKGCNKKLIRAVLSYFSYKYFMNDYVLEPELFDIIRKEINYAQNQIAVLALLKYYAAQGYLNDVETNFAEYHIRQLAKEGIVLPFFQEFAGKLQLPQEMANLVYVEYHANPKKRVFLYYLEEGSGKPEFRCEEMKNVCYGVFVKAFTLFYNETLQYYIMEEENGERQITESYIKSMNEELVAEEEPTRYGQLNLLLLAQDMQDEKTATELMEQYFRAEYAVEHLFSPL